MARPKIANSIVDVIGGTPMIRLNRLSSSSKANILLKLESMEPCNSVKDRIGIYNPSFHYYQRIH